MVKLVFGDRLVKTKYFYLHTIKKSLKYELLLKFKMSSRTGFVFLIAFVIYEYINLCQGNSGSCFTNCGQILENCHILVCPKLNEGSSYSYEKLTNGSLFEMKEALTVWRENITRWIQYFKNIVNPMILILCCD